MNSRCLLTPLQASFFVKNVLRLAGDNYLGLKLKIHPMLFCSERIGFEIGTIWQSWKTRSDSSPLFEDSDLDSCLWDSDSDSDSHS